MTDRKLEKRSGELLMEFPCEVTALKKVDGRLFAVLKNGQAVDVTELLGEARH